MGILALEPPLVFAQWRISKRIVLETLLSAPKVSHILIKFQRAIPLISIKIKGILGFE